LEEDLRNHHFELGASGKTGTTTYSRFFTKPPAGSKPG